MSDAPPCIGDYAPNDLTCNGNPLGVDQEDRRPCGWRDRCTGLQIYAERKETGSETIRAILSEAELVRIGDHCVRRFGVVAGQATVFPPLPAGHKPQKDTRKARKRPPRVLKFSDDLLSLHVHFVARLRIMFPDRVFASGNQVITKPGVFYPVDRIAKSGYVRWYCSAPDQDVGLASVHFKVKPGLVNVHIPLEIEDVRSILSTSILRKVDPTGDDVSGQFRTLCRGLGREGLSIVVDILERAHNLGMLVLPEIK